MRLNGGVTRRIITIYFHTHSIICLCRLRAVLQAENRFGNLYFCCAVVDAFHSKQFQMELFRSLSRQVAFSLSVSSPYHHAVFVRIVGMALTSSLFISIHPPHSPSAARKLRLDFQTDEVNRTVIPLFRLHFVSAADINIVCEHFTLMSLSQHAPARTLAHSHTFRFSHLHTT